MRFNGASVSKLGIKALSNDVRAPLLRKHMSILPEGEQLRKAIKWISDERLDNPGARLSNLINDACLKFDLPPKDAESLLRFFAEE